jgi:hypothetical protein
VSSATGGSKPLISTTSKQLDNLGRGIVAPVPPLVSFHMIVLFVYMIADSRMPCSASLEAALTAETQGVQTETAAHSETHSTLKSLPTPPAVFGALPR